MLPLAVPVAERSPVIVPDPVIVPPVISTKVPDDVATEVTVPVNWLDRLFTFPFKPFDKYRIEYEWKDTLKDGDIIKMNNGLHMNAKTFDDCRKAIKDKSDRTFNAY